MGALASIQDGMGRPRVARLAVALTALGLLGAGATRFAPAALAGSAGGGPHLAQLAGAPAAPPPGAPPPAQPPPPGAPPAQRPTGMPPPPPLQPGAPPPAAAVGARPPAPPPAPPPPPAPAPPASAEPSVRVVLAPDARGPLPPAVVMPASQVPAGAVPPAGAGGGQVPASAAPGAPPNGSAAGALSRASGTAPGAGSSPGRVEAGPSAALRLVSVAQSQLGARYTWGGATPASGFDCSGFVYWAYSQIGRPLPRGMADQFASGRRVRVEELQPGDILFYQNTYTAGLSHNGIYVGDGKFIHAADESTGVVLTPVRSAYWEQRFAGAIRVLD